MPLFSELKFNNYVPQYVGMPLNEYLGASTAIQDRYNQVQEGYSLVGELADTLQTSPLATDRDVKRQLVTDIQSKIEAAAQRGDFDTMQNEMRKLAKDYAKKAAPIKENLARYTAAEQAIMNSKLPTQHINYLRSNLQNKPGLSFDEDGLPTYTDFGSFAENVDLREIYDKYINDYKSDKAPNGVRKVIDPSTGLVEYFAIGSNERVDPNEVMAGLQQLAIADPKIQAFVLQDAAANGQEIKSSEDFFNYANPLMIPFANKAGFSKEDMQIRVGEAGRARAKAAGDNLDGMTFDINWGIPAQQGTASPTHLRKTREGLDQTKATLNDEYGKWLQQTGVDALSGKTKDGKDHFKKEWELYNLKLDGIDAQKWELDKVEQAAKRDAGLPATYVPNKKVLDTAEKAYDDAILSIKNSYEAQDLPVPLNEEELDKIGTRAYNKSIETSNDPSLKAYRAALAKNAQDRTIVKGMTSFNKNMTAELDRLGDALVAGTWGNVVAYDVATGRELTDIKEYGSTVKNAMWTVDNGNVVLTYQTGEMDKQTFVPSGKWIKVQAPPELERQLVQKGAIDPLDLTVMKQAATGKINLGKLKAEFHVKRAAETGPAQVVVVLEDGTREAFPGQGDAIKFLSNLAKIVNGNR